MDWFERHFDKVFIGWFVVGGILTIGLAGVVIWGVIRLVTHFTGV